MAGRRLLVTLAVCLAVWTSLVGLKALLVSARQDARLEPQRTAASLALLYLLGVLCMFLVALVHMALARPLVQL